MATLTVTADEDYRDGSPSLFLTDQIVFATTGVALARFNSSQFGPTQVSNTVAITGDGNANIIVVHTPSDAVFSAAGWTFTDWSVNDQIKVFGTSAPETITGSSKPNSIEGGGGADVLTGGASDDVFTYSSDDAVAGETVNGLGGTDQISLFGETSFDFSDITLTSIEQLSFSGTVTLTGGQIGSGAITEVAANGSVVPAVIVFGASVNLGAVAFTGWTAGSTITINCNTDSGGNLTGSGQIDIINGGAGVDVLDGGDGADTLDGGASADTLKGRAGSDTYVVGGGDVIDESGSDGTDTVLSSVNFSLGDTVHVKGAVENLTLVGAALNGTGNGLVNTITGNANANTLDGAGGGDTMRGLAGNDTYVVRNANDVVDESAPGSGGTDTVLAHISYSLAAVLGSVEALTLIGDALNATGNGSANTITGNANANTLDGKGGDDTMRGLGGNDTYVVDNLGDVVDESTAGSDGTDTVLSSVNVNLGGGAANFVSLAASGLGAIENITLTGNAIEATGNDLANVITGNASANRLTGGLGPDLFTGGIGGDTFVLASLEDSGKKASARDTILDFTADDFIDLSAIDAKKGSKDSHFKFIKKQGFHDKKGELHYQKKGSDLVVSGDVNGDGKADFSILVTDLKKFAASDFVL